MLGGLAGRVSARMNAAAGGETPPLRRRAVSSVLSGRAVGPSREREGGATYQVAPTAASRAHREGQLSRPFVCAVQVRHLAANHRRHRWVVGPAY